MKSKILFISLAVVLALSVGLIGCGEAGPTVPTAVKVGLVREVTNPALAVFDWIAGGPAYRWYADNVNADVGHAGEIHLDVYDTATEECWVPVELVVRTFDMTNWPTLGQETTALINTDKVDFVWGGPGTDTIYTQAPICNAAGTLLITLEGGASKMVWEAATHLDVWPYVWVSLSFSNWYQLPLVAEMINDKVGGDAKAYVTHIGGYGAEHGLEYLQATKDAFGAGNVTDAGAHDGVLTAITAQAIITAAKTALVDPCDPAYDIFCAFTYPDNVKLLTKAAMDLSFNPPAMIFGPGANFGDYPYSFGGDPPDPSLVAGIMAFAVATRETTVTVGNATMSMPDLYDAMEAQLAADQVTVPPKCPIPAPPAMLLDYWGHPCYVASLEMWKYAVEDVGELDSGAIRAVLASYNSPNPAETCFGSTWYEVFGGGLGGGVMDYECLTGQIGQWQLNVGNVSEMKVVGPADAGQPVAGLPNYDVTANFTYPMTDLWAWVTPECGS